MTRDGFKNGHRKQYLRTAAKIQSSLLMTGNGTAD